MMKHRSIARIILGICFVATLNSVLVPCARGQRGGMTIPRNLEQMVSQAEVILRGRVTDAHLEPHPLLHHLPTIVVSLRVDEVLKGQVKDSFTFRQFVWDVRDRLDVAGYAKGDEVLLLLNPPTRYGLTSPVGLEQGRFRLLRDEQGRTSAVNGHGNVGLFRGLAELSRARKLQLSAEAQSLIEQPYKGPVPYDQLRDLVRQLAGSK